jgi:nitrite reductase/ring-hydroxylating ferredoxin subunit
VSTASVPERHVIGPAGSLPGASAVEAFDRTIAVFNVDGTLFAFDNRCPHHGGPLCRGRVSDAPFADQPGEVRWERDQRILRCPWHRWEFDMDSRRALWGESVRLRGFAVEVEDGQVVLYDRPPAG